jgi:amino acid transporter
MFGGGLTVCYAYSKLIAAMADSKLLPAILSRRTTGTAAPIYSLIFGQVIGLLFCVYAVLLSSDAMQWPNITAFCAFITYSIQMCGFVVMKTKLAHFKKEFSSPFGVAGGLFGLLVFVIGMFSCLIYHNKRLSIVAVYLILVSVYYGVYARHKQTFSNAEQLVVLPAHVEIRNANGEFLALFICVMW